MPSITFSVMNTQSLIFHAPTIVSAWRLLPSWGLNVSTASVVMVGHHILLHVYPGCFPEDVLKEKTFLLWFSRNNWHHFCYRALSMWTFSLTLTSSEESESDLRVLQNCDSQVEPLIYSSRNKEVIDILIMIASKCLWTGSHFLILGTKKHRSKSFSTRCYLPGAIFPMLRKHVELPKSLNSRIW